MKVLDPQSAHLPLPELHSFLARHHATSRPKEKQIGTYPAVNLSGLNAVTKDLRAYITDVAPHLTNQAPVEDWMVDVVGKLKGYGLVQSEVVQLLNLGVGAKGGETEEETNGIAAEMEVEGEDLHSEHVNGETNGGDRDEEGMASINETLFRLVVEDSEERFAGEDGEGTVQEILEILRTGVKRKGSAANGSGRP